MGGVTCCKTEGLSNKMQFEPLADKQPTTVMAEPEHNTTAKPDISNFTPPDAENEEFTGDFTISPSIADRRKQLGDFKYLTLPEGTYTEGNCKPKHPTGELLPSAYKIKSTGVIYAGEWRHGKRHGKGLYMLKDDKGKNEWLLECMTTYNEVKGHGRIIFQDGSYYEGNIENNQARGQGKYVKGDVTYIGEFEKSIQHGKGVETTQTKAYKFEGTYSYGKRVEGKLTWPDKDEKHTQDEEDFGYYEGPFVDDKFSGKGTLKTRDGLYEGSFKNGQRSGIGKFTYNNATFYFGDFKEDKRNGKGLVCGTDGVVKYSGDWVDDKFVQN